MLGETKQANSATTAVTFITLGSLMSVWSSVYYVYLTRHEASDWHFLWTYGFFFSGLVLIVIGVCLGRIGRVVREAEVTVAPPGHAPAPGTGTAPAAGTAPTPAATAPPANGVVQVGTPATRRS